MIRRISTQRAEASRRELMFTKAAYLDLVRVHAARTSSKPRIPTDPLAYRGSAEYLTLPYIVAIAEEFARNALVESSEPVIGTDPHPLIADLWAAAEERSESWPRQVDAWKKWHSIDVTTEAAYKAFRPAVEARNAIVHGLGTLTRRQTRKDGGRATAEMLRTSGITVQSGRVVVDAKATADCIKRAGVFIDWLDEKTRTSGLRR